ncbi:hypothetical protein GCM10027299_44440 [Larkinella ripae]
MSGSQANLQLNPKWSRQVQESFDLYHDLEVLRDKVQSPEAIQSIDDSQRHLLFTLNSIFMELGAAPPSSEQFALKEFMRQISRRVQAENRLVKSVINQINTTLRVQDVN